MNEEDKFCHNCGAPAKKSNADYGVQLETESAGYQRPYMTNGTTEGNIPAEYQPISMWGYFGYQVLFSLPCIGIILLIVFSVGGTKNKNLQNFARSYFCFTILLLILLMITGLAGGMGALTSSLVS